MTFDRERIEREARECFDGTYTDLPADIDVFVKRVTALVHRERAAALEMAADKIQAAGSVNEIPHSELVRALAAQERGA